MWIVLKELRDIDPLKANFIFLFVKKTLDSFFVASRDGNGKVGNIVSPPSHEGRGRKSFAGRFTQLCSSQKDKHKEKRQKKLKMVD